MMLEIDISTLLQKSYPATVQLHRVVPFYSLYESFNNLKTGTTALSTIDQQLQTKYYDGLLRSN